MGLEFYFSNTAADIRDRTNATGRHPPFLLELGVADGSVWFSIGHDGDRIDQLRQCGLTPREARRLLIALEDAIRAAER